MHTKEERAILVGTCILNQSHLWNILGTYRVISVQHLSLYKLFGQKRCIYVFENLIIEGNKLSGPIN